MDSQPTSHIGSKSGAEDAGRYFQYMAEFIGFTSADCEAIKQSAPALEKHLPEIVGSFYGHLLRYPPTRKFFLKGDGTVDQAYLELRMRHLTNFWLRTASGVYDEEYARYLDYIGRAHTSHGADPGIYVAERYVIGQVGFMQHAISVALMNELRHVDEALEMAAVEAWDKLLMVILELLSRAYGGEREAETFDALMPVEQSTVNQLASGVFAEVQVSGEAKTTEDLFVAMLEEIPDGQRRIVALEGLSIGVFHHKGCWFALRNYCLHRGGPVATGELDGDTVTCPWHGFQYDITNGQLLVDPKVALQMYPVTVRDGKVHITIPQQRQASASVTTHSALGANELPLGEPAPGQVKLVHVAGQDVAVYNIDGELYATQNKCTHVGGPLNEGALEGKTITCPWHGSCFEITNGQVLHGPATQALQTFCVSVKPDRVSISVQ